MRCGWLTYKQFEDVLLTEMAERGMKLSGSGGGGGGGGVAAIFH